MTPRFLRLLSCTLNQRQVSTSSIRSRTSFSTATAPQDPRPDKMRLVFDFDGTITLKDTISVLADSAIDFHKRTHHMDVGPKWIIASQTYQSQLRRYQNQYHPQAKDRQRLSEEVAYMEAMNTVELDSLERVGSLVGLFSGMDDTDLYEFGKQARRTDKVVLRDGFVDLCRHALNEGWSLSVISVNWSRHFIGGVLAELDSNISIVANHITPTGKIEGPAALQGVPLTDATGKLKVLTPLLSKDRCIYFGDSTTDLTCLLQHYGVAMFNLAEPSVLIQTLVRIGHAPQSVAVSPDMDLHFGQIFSARDFREVMQSGFVEKAARN